MGLACCQSIIDCAPANDVVLYATDSLKLADRVKILKDDGAASGRVVSLAASGIQLGVGARIGDVLSRGDVTLANNAGLLGTVTTQGVIVRGQNNQVTGPVVEHGAVAVPDLSGFAKAFPGTGGSNIVVERSQVLTLAPGSYGTLDVRGGGLLKLSSGVYSFTALTTDHQSTVDLHTTLGAVIIHAQGAVAWGAQPTTTNNEAKLALISYSSGDTVVEAPFAGTLIAPFGGISLRSMGAPYFGAFFAKRIDVQPDVTVIHRSPVAPSISGAQSAPPVTPGAISIAVSMRTDWGSGYCADVSIRNQGTAPTKSWSFVMGVPGASIYDSWGATRSGASDNVLATSLSWDAVIAPGSSIQSVGFCANRTVAGAMPAILSASATY